MSDLGLLGVRPPYTGLVLDVRARGSRRLVPTRLPRPINAGMNGQQLRADIDAGERLVIAVATGSTDEIKTIAQALRDLAEPPM